MSSEAIKYFDVKVGQSLAIGDDIRIMVQKKSGQLARLGVSKPDTMGASIVAEPVMSVAAKGLTLAKAR